jgi:hypothetical protein
VQLQHLQDLQAGLDRLTYEFLFGLFLGKGRLNGLNGLHLFRLEVGFDGSGEEYLLWCLLLDWLFLILLAVINMKRISFWKHCGERDEFLGCQIHSEYITWIVFARQSLCF